MNTKELVEDLISGYEDALNNQSEYEPLSTEDIQAYATLVLARASMR